MEGFEPHLGVNHYGHFLLRRLLLPTLQVGRSAHCRPSTAFCCAAAALAQRAMISSVQASSPSRVVVIGSCLHDRNVDQQPTTLDLTADPKALGGPCNHWMAYSRSKVTTRGASTPVRWPRELPRDQPTRVTSYPPIRAHVPHLRWCASQLANVLSAAAAGPKLAPSGVAIVSLHPGIDVTTRLFRHNPLTRRVMSLFASVSPA